jgi:hypothetical protein
VVSDKKIIIKINPNRYKQRGYSLTRINEKPKMNSLQEWLDPDAEKNFSL